MKFGKVCVKFERAYEQVYTSAIIQSDLQIMDILGTDRQTVVSFTQNVILYSLFGTRLNVLYWIKVPMHYIITSKEFYYYSLST